MLSFIWFQNFSSCIFGHYVFSSLVSWRTIYLFLLKILYTLWAPIAPLLAIASMKFFKLSNFFEGNKLVFQHLLFLVILTALYNTLMKFFAFAYFDNFSINAVKFIQGYLLGDILGCLTILFFTALVIVPGIRYFAPQLIPSDIEN